MIHATKKYNEGHMDTIPEDEPVFLLRGQDPYAAMAVSYWLACQANNHPRRKEVSEHIKLMKAWPNKE